MDVIMALKLDGNSEIGADVKRGGGDLKILVEQTSGHF